MDSFIHKFENSVKNSCKKTSFTVAQILLIQNEKIKTYIITPQIYQSLLLMISELYRNVVWRDCLYYYNITTDNKIKKKKISFTNKKIIMYIYLLFH